MSLLDDLEQEAQRRKASVDDAERARQQREEVYRTRLEPGMVALHDYLSKLTGNLAIIRSSKIFTLPIPGYGEVVFQVEHEYDLKLQSQHTAKEIRLAFPCVVRSEECPMIEVLGASKVKAVAGAFQRLRLGGLVSNRKDASGEVIAATFRAKGRISADATFFADAESAQVRMSFVNFDQIGGTRTKTVSADQFNDAIYDEIGRYLVREPNALFREALPEDYRKHLRTKVQQAELKRRWEMQIAERQREELAKIEREQSLGGKLSKAIDQISGGLLGKLRGLVRKGR